MAGDRTNSEAAPRRLLGCSETASLWAGQSSLPQIQGQNPLRPLGELRNKEKFQEGGASRCEPVGILGTPLVPQPCQAGIALQPWHSWTPDGPCWPRLPWWECMLHLTPAFPGSVANSSPFLMPLPFCLASVQAFRDAPVRPICTLLCPQSVRELRSPC